LRGIALGTAGVGLKEKEEGKTDMHDTKTSGGFGGVTHPQGTESDSSPLGKVAATVR